MVSDERLRPGFYLLGMTFAIELAGLLAMLLAHFAS